MHRTTNTKECSALFRSLVTDRLLPRLREFAPELVIISAGFDGHTEDIKGNK
jgi:acetoin utilization deacetylase AcuC-like enzyme